MPKRNNCHASVRTCNLQASDLFSWVVANLGLLMQLQGGRMDRLLPRRRSWNMSRIKGRDTSPEKIVRKIISTRGYRYRLHRSDLPGKPDIVFVS